MKFARLIPFRFLPGRWSGVRYWRNDPASDCRNRPRSRELRFACRCVVAAVALLAAMGAAQAEVVFGFVTSLSGPVSSLGIPYEKGLAAAMTFASEISGEKVRVIELDDGSDPSVAARNARKLIEDDKVDLILGTAGVPSALAMATVAAELHVPMIALAPIPQVAAGDGGPWVIAVPQPAQLMVDGVAQRMRSQGVRTVAYIGFSDALGDQFYDSLVRAAAKFEITVVANERYSRADTSVTAQALKIVALHPDAVMTGGAGTPGALPFLALAERGYRGPVFGNHGLVNADFVRVGGTSTEGAICPSGPEIVAEQLPDDNPTKSVGLAFRVAYRAANGVAANDAFAPIVFDAWLLALEAVRRSVPAAKPGTQEFRNALRDALVNTRDVVGSLGVYNFTPASVYGVDERARVMVRLINGEWKLLERTGSKP